MFSFQIIRGEASEASRITKLRHPADKSNNKKGTERSIA